MIATVAWVVVGLSVVFNLVFIVRFGWPERHPDRGMATFLASTAWQQLALDVVALVLLVGFHLSPWVVLAVLAFGDVVAGWRLWFLLQARREEA